MDTSSSFTLLTIVTPGSKSMEHIKTFPKGSTVVLFQRGFNRKEYRTCSPGGGLCTYNACLDRAMNFAQVYEDYYNHKPSKTFEFDINL